MDKLCEILVDTTNHRDKYKVRLNYQLLKSFQVLFYKKRQKIKKFHHNLPYPCELETLSLEHEIDTLTGTRLSHSSDPNQELTRILSELPHNKIQFYTDGSKNEIDNHTGLAIYSPVATYSKMYKATLEASVFTLEAVAISKALETIQTNRIPDSLILSDSLSVLEAIKNYSPITTKKVSYLILEIKKVLWELSDNGQKVSMMWIPAHKNIKGNELADKLAKFAITNGKKIDIPLPVNDLEEEIKANLLKSHYSFIKRQQLIKGTTYFKNYFKENPKPWFYMTNMKRSHITTINRLRSNHYSLAESLYRKNMVTSPSCPCGAPIEDIDHVLWECTKYDQQRTTLIKKLNRNKTLPPFNTTAILKDPKGKNAKFVTEFLESCDLKV